MRASLEQHLGSRQVGRIVYGSIIGMALLVAIEGHPPRPGVMAVWLLGTALAVGLAEVYSDVVGTRPARGGRSRAGTWGTWPRTPSRSASASPSRPSSSCSSALGRHRHRARRSRSRSGPALGLIGFYGFWAARFSGAAPHVALLKGVLVALIGAGLILLKSLVH